MVISVILIIIVNIFYILGFEPKKIVAQLYKYFIVFSNILLSQKFVCGNNWRLDVMKYFVNIPWLRWLRTPSGEERGSSWTLKGKNQLVPDP